MQNTRIIRYLPKRGRIIGGFKSSGPVSKHQKMANLK